MSQLKKGAILTYVKIVLTNIIGLFLTPFIIRSLGDSEYGLYILVGSFVAYLGLMNLGINNAIIRYVAKYKAKNDKVGEREFLATAMRMYFVISFCLVLIGIGLYFNLNSIFSNSLNLEEIRKAKVMFVLLVANLAIALPGGAFLAICQGYESFVFPSILSIARYVVRALAICAVLLLGGKAISIVVVDTVLSVIAIAISMIFVIRKLNVTISLKFFKKSLVKDIFSYSLWVFLFGIVYKFQWNAGQIVLGVTTDTVSVAIYGVGVLLGGYYGAFAGGINSVLIPRATQMVVKKSNGKELTKEMVKIGRLNSYILFLVLGGFFLFGQAFIKLWVGDTYQPSWVIAFLLMCVMTLPLIQAFGNSILEAKKKNRFKSLISVFTVGSGVVIGYFLSQKYGIFGIAIPLVVAMGANSLIMNYYYTKIFDFKTFFFVRNALLGPILINVGVAILGFYFLQFLEMSTWLLFLTCAGIYAVFNFFITYMLLMNDYEKSLFKKLFKIGTAQ